MGHIRFDEPAEDDSMQAEEASPPPHFSTSALHLVQTLNGDAPASGCYVLDLASSPDGSLLAASLSNFHVALHTLPQDGAAALRPACAPFRAGGAPLVHLSFLSDAPSSLLTASADGRLRLFDARAPATPSACWVASGRELSAAAASSFSLSAGTEDGCVLLWDRRRPGAATVAELADAHAGQAVTCLAAHPLEPNALLSGGVDGAVCVFDLSRSADEDEALLQYLSVGPSVARLGFFGDAAQGLWVTTGTEELQLWRWREADRLSAAPRDAAGDACTSREALGGAASRAAASAGLSTVDYIIRCDWDAASGRLHALAGAQGGAAGAWPVALPQMPRANADASASLDAPLAFGAPAAVLSGGHCDIVRALELRGGAAVSGGEDGRLCLWAPGGAVARREARHSPSSSGGRYAPY